MIIIYRVGMALVEKLAKLDATLTEHTRIDIAAHAEVREDLATLQSRMDVALDLTPVRGIPKQRARSEPGTGYYPPRKPGREG